MENNRNLVGINGVICLSNLARDCFPAGYPFYDTKMKSLIFARVSSKEQEETGYSLDSQVKLLEEYEQKKQFTKTKTFRVAESASGKQIRKVFNEMLQYATKNKVQIIICEKIDRLIRNLKDAASVSDWFQEDPEREVHFVKENFIVNKNTKAHENLVWDMKVAIARFYINNLSEEVRKGQKEKLAQGWLPTKPPIGYQTIGEQGHKTHILDGIQDANMIKAFELCATGNYSLKELVEVMYQTGLRNGRGGKVLKSRLHELLKDPFYYGMNRWNKKVSQGLHKPLISKALFDTVQDKLTRKKTSPRYRKHRPVFKGKIFCEECRGTITWEIQRGHWYGHCNHYKDCSQDIYARQENVEEQLFPVMSDTAPDNDWVLGWLDRAIKSAHRNESETTTARREEMDRLIQIADQRMERAYRDKLDGNHPELSERAIKESQKEKEELLETIKGLQESQLPYHEAGYAIHELARHAVEIYNSEKATTEDRRLLLGFVFSNILLNAGKITPALTLAFLFLREWMPKVNKNFEQTKNPNDNGASGVVASLIPRSMSPEANKNFEPQETLMLRHDLGIADPNHDICSAARTRTWNHRLTLIHNFRYGVDYIFPELFSWRDFGI